MISGYGHSYHCWHWDHVLIIYNILFLGGASGTWQEGGYRVQLKMYKWWVFWWDFICLHSSILHTQILFLKVWRRPWNAILNKIYSKYKWTVNCINKKRKIQKNRNLLLVFIWNCEGGVVGLITSVFLKILVTALFMGQHTHMKTCSYKK